MSENWSRTENEAIVAEYLKMLEMELAGVPFVKTEYNRAVQEMTGRTRRAVEDKFMNISAVLVERGYDSIDGYKPYGNYQRDLAEAIDERFLEQPTIVDAIRRNAEDPIDVIPDFDQLWKRVKKAPVSRLRPLAMIGERSTGDFRREVNWFEKQARDVKVGLAGEQFVLAFERARLNHLGKENLADRVEHVSLTEGDGAGFDIRSFEASGADRLIEVKTTSAARATPFYLSRNEVEVSEMRKIHYQLYRVFRLRSNPRLYMLKGSMREVCALDPVQYLARPR